MIKLYIHCGSKKNAPTLADYNYDPVQSILIIFSKLFDNDHKSCLVVKFSTSPHISTLPGTEVLCQKMKTFQETTLKKLQVSTVASIV